MTTTGLKAAWRRLRDAGHRLDAGTDIEAAFETWATAFEGVDDAVLGEAVGRWISWVASGGCPYSDGGRFPSTWVLGGLIAEEHRRRPPTEADLQAGRWWPPTGSTATRDQWMWSRASEAVASCHRDAGCAGVWRSEDRLAGLMHANYSGTGLAPEWPDPPGAKTHRAWIERNRSASCGGLAVGLCLVVDPSRAGEAVAAERARLMAREGEGSTLRREHTLAAWLRAGGQP